MKNLYLILLFVTLPSFATEVLETKNYRVSIESRCMEGEVSCSNYIYKGMSKKSGSEIQLKGSSWHTKCADGSPCRFLGYQFKNGNITYYVHQDGLLEVIQNKNKVLLSEQGNWL
ncbi:hypothetical protein MUS1_08305 [Marinomonas ushuaiensis DSM 15871]|uniref:Uncharacterized protein n=1 Tax=Marinomonas ushuaiensis DSM 15871 TaxID=1122207 RepID=X7E9S7_9GAMM|nr:hypothetical protein [Marinomonas ushuaiensis]ETX11931.1 hypothetical protein MUS1_08305 [Marinomonas ushuaiensis DSM 15871]